MSLIARLGVVLGINSSEFTKGIADADTRTKNFKKTLREAQQTADAMKTGISIAGAALVGFGVHVAGVADDMSDLADANDTTVGSIIELQHALEMSGGKAENAKVMLSAFTNAIDGAAQGSDKLRDSFKAAGVSIHDLATMSGDELRTKALAGLTEIDDAVRRNAVAMDLFGKAAKGVDFLQMSSNAEQLKGRYKEQEKAVQDAAAAFQKIKIVIADMEVAAIKAMQPISNFINELPTENKVEALAKAFTILGDVMFAAFAVKAVLGVKALSAQLTVLATKNPYLFAFLASAAAYQAYSSTNDSQATHPNMAGEEGGALIFKLGGAFAGRPTANEMEGYEKANQAFPQGTIEESKFPIRREIVVTDKQKKAIEDAKKLEQDFIEVLDSAIDRQNKFNNEIYNLRVLQKEKNNLMIDEYNDSVDLLDLEGKRYKISESDYAKSKLALTQKIELRKIDSQMAQEESAAMTELGRASAEDYARSKEIYNQKILNIQKNAEMQKIIAKELDLIETRQLDDSISRQESWAAGWEEAMIRYEEASKKASTQGAAAFENVVGTMNSALAKFVETGKLNFKDLIGTMIKQMLLAKMQAEASGFFSMLAKTALSYFTGGASGASGGSAGSIVGDLFGGMTGHASGGAISSPSIVGENGAELFIPRTPGTIIPNGAWQSQVAGNNGGMTINGNYIANMSAIDTQSGMQFLAKNRDTIWAAYQSANRSVPISR